jgi:hypothetical protein
MSFWAVRGQCVAEWHCQYSGRLFHHKKLLPRDEIETKATFVLMSVHGNVTRLSLPITDGLNLRI